MQRLAILLLPILLFACRRTNHEKPYLDLLPADAVEIQSTTIAAGIDYSVFIKAKITRDDFSQFIGALGLREGDSKGDTRAQDDEVKNWWSPKRDSTNYSRLDYDPNSKIMRAALWATYEDGYLFFHHTDF